eukprot:87697-Amphidinium_carterae.1
MGREGASTSPGGTPALSSRGVLGKATPSSAVPSTLQVPGSGIWLSWLTPSHLRPKLWSNSEAAILMSAIPSD